MPAALALLLLITLPACVVVGSLGWMAVWKRRHRPDDEVEVAVSGFVLSRS